MSLLVAAAPAGRSTAAGKESKEPTGASLAWTSDDPVVVQARALIADGKLAEAEALLKKDDPSASPQSKAARAEGVDMIARLRYEYADTADDLLKKLRGQVSASQLEQWRNDGGVQAKLFDGKWAYFRREPSNMARFCGPYKEIAQHGRKGQDEQGEDWTLVGHLQHVADEAEKTGQTYVLPIKMHVKYSVTVPIDADGMKPGATMKVWLPYPQEYGKRQFDIKMVSTSPSSPQIAPTSTGEHPLGGAPQRSVYFEAKVPDPVKPMVFEEVFEYTSQAYYPTLNEALAQPLPADYKDGNLGERLPHIAFTPELKATVADIIRGETNPLAQARKIFHWISSNIAYQAQEEYCLVPSFSQEVLKNRKGDCGFFATLFVTMCREAGIPARWQSGWETKPNDWTFHDWAEFYVAPWGWLPADSSYGVQKSDDPRIRDFYCGHTDSYRLIVNRDWGVDLQPPKHSVRSEPADFQRGEVEIDGKNLYFSEWDYDMQFTWGSKP